MSKKIYVRIDYAGTIENRPSDFGATLKYAGYQLFHLFSSGMSGAFPKYFAVAGETFGDIDYTTYSVRAVQSAKPADYFTKWTSDGKTAAWWEVTVPDTFVVPGSTSTSGVAISAGPTFNPPTPTKIVNGNDNPNTLNGTNAAELVNGRGGNDIINLAGANDHASAGAGDDIVKGGLGHDSMSGGLGVDRIYGEAGDDFLFGDEGNDYLNGGDGNDLLSGYIGNDVLLGGAGNDRLQGGVGRDTLTGGLGRDVFRFQSAAVAANSDRILDFKQGEDQIQLSKDFYVANTNRIKFDHTSGEIFYDTAGFSRTGDYVTLAVITPNIWLTTSDIVFI